MDKDIFRRFDGYLIGIIFITLVSCIVFAGHYNSVLIDLGREMLYPERILEGKILYKDLFNIYGPMSYMLNALWYKLFGINLKTLYSVGVGLLLLYCVGLYFIGKLFLNKIQSFLVAFFSVVLLGMAPLIFNFTMPYSFALTYGTVFSVWALFFVIKYQLESKNYQVVAAAFLVGCAVANKYEFIPFALLILCFGIYKAFKNDVKILLYSLVSMFVPIILSFGILFAQGLDFSDLFNSVKILSDIANSKTLSIFYKSVGIMFSPQTIKLCLSAFLKFSLIFVMIYALVKAYNKYKISFYLLIIPILSISIMLISNKYQEIFLFLPLMMSVVFIVKLKTLSVEKRIMIFGALLLCLKTFWGLVVYSYGSFSAPILVLALFVIFSDTDMKRSLAIFLSLICFVFALKGGQLLNLAQSPISTSKGTIYTNDNLARSVNQLMNFINTNSTSEDSIVIFPEGMTINFLTNRMTDDFYNTLIPLYVESFGEDEIIKHYSDAMPEYFIFTNSNLKEYGVANICNDYAYKFCSFVDENYSNVKIIDNGTRFLIYKRK